MDVFEERISKRTQLAIGEKVFPGCVIGITRTNGEGIIFPFGTFIYESAEKKVDEDTVYDLASVTKSIPLASLTALYIKEGKLNLSDAVKKYIPELQNDFDATIEDLLLYRVQGSVLSKLPFKTFEELRTHVLETGFSAPPGKSAYTNLPAFLLGIVIERIGEASIAAQADKYFFSPLGMQNTTFFPAATLCAPTEIDGRGSVQGLPHDESAYLFAVKRRSVGHAGLFSTAPDLLLFLEALLTDKYSYIVDAAEKGLGWQVSDSNFMGTYAGPKTFGKTGFTGTSILCDKEKGLALVILSNRTYPKRPSNDEAIFSFRRDIADIVLGSA